MDAFNTFNDAMNVIQYFDHSLNKVVEIDVRTGFSRYREFKPEVKTEEDTETGDLSVASTPDMQTLCVSNKSLTALTVTDNGMDCGDGSTDTRDTIGTRVESISTSIKLSRALLAERNVRVVGQVSRQLIVCLLVDEHLLVAFDQHAVHERIRYENILRESFASDGSIKTRPVLPPLEIAIDSPQLRDRIARYGTQIKRLVGFALSEHQSGGNNSYLLTHIPMCIERSLDSDTIVAIIEELVSILDDSANTHTPIIKLTTPKLLERLQSLACHGAIRFGNELKWHDCQRLIHSLSRCKSSFRCAHGRPNVAPLFHLPAIDTNK